MSLIIEKSMSDGWLSNTWLIGDEPGGHAVLVDTGGPPEPILQAIEAHRLTVTHVLCTHHHIDHVQFNDEYKSKFGCPICGSSREAELFGALDTQLNVLDGAPHRNERALFDASESGRAVGAVHGIGGPTMK